MTDFESRPEAEVPLARRTFLASLVSAPAVLATPEFPTKGPTQASTAPPSQTLFASDALVLYVDMLLEVQTEAIDSKGTAWTAASAEVSGLVDELVQTLEALDREVSASAILPDGQVAMLTASGQVVRLQLQRSNGLSSADDTAAVARFADACVACIDVNEGHSNVQMSRRARQLIDTAVMLARRLAPKNAEAVKANKEFQETFQTVTAQLKVVRDRLSAAAAAAVLVVDASTPIRAALDQRERALTQLEGAVEALRQVAEPTSPSMYPTRDALLEILDGTRTWILSIQERQNVAPGMLAVPADPVTPERSQSVRSSLDEFSPAATFLRVLWLQALVTPVWLRYPLADVPNRERLLRIVLKAFPSSPPAAGNAKFVSSLARIS
jgi:hypothetical protein